MILAFTGAGISKASGIPTFEDQGDMRLKLSRSYSIENPDDFRCTIQLMVDNCSKGEPNDAHVALSEYNIPIITMNVDNLHQRAGSRHILPIHGTLSKMVLYGDPAPLYMKAHEWVDHLMPGDTFLVIGASDYTNISVQLRICARATGADIVTINDRAEDNVRKYIESHKDRLGVFEEFMGRDIEI